MLYHPISAPEDYHHLQEDINRLCTWTNDNLLKYNANKCKYMVISRKKQPLVPCTPLRVNQIAMEAVGSYKYLGVWLTSSLDWSEQIASVCKKARQQIGIIYKRFYGHLNSWALRQMYLSYVCPHLECAVPVWDPHHLGHIEALEKVQRFALKMCTKSWDSSYEDMLTFCNLPTLCQRRRVLKLTLLYQLMHGHFIFPNAPLERRSIPCILRHVHPSTSTVNAIISYKCTPVLFFPSCHIHLEFTARQYSLSRYCVLI